MNQDRASDWIVRTMDDETVFGVELYRKSYVEAVRNGWLADYRIIAVGVNGPDAYHIANTLAGENKGTGSNRLTSTHFLRGLAFSLAMGGATQNNEQDTVAIKSCIAFMNTTDKSNKMQEALQTPAVRKWVQDWLDDNQIQQKAAHYALEHLEAKDNVTARDNAKVRLAEATSEHPHGVLNVGIFGRGHRLAIPQRGCLPGSAEEPNRRDPGRGSVHAHQRGQGDGLHHLPNRDPGQRRP